MPVTEMEHLAQAFQRLLDSAALTELPRHRHGLPYRPVLLRARAAAAVLVSVARMIVTDKPARGLRVRNPPHRGRIAAAADASFLIKIVRSATAQRD
jgi:hypothetical protein